MATWTGATLGTWNVSENTFSKISPADTFASYIVSTGQADGTVNQTASCSVVTSGSIPQSAWGFQSGTPYQDSDTGNGWVMQMYPEGGSQKVKVRINGSGTDYAQSYTNSDVFKILMTPDSVIFQKNGVTFHTETTWLPQSGTTYFLQANHLYTGNNMTCEYDPPAPITTTTRFPPPPITVRF